jgi:hypothetical protein
VLVQLEGQGVDLALELAQPSCEAVALVAERLGQGYHRLDEPLFAVVGVRGLGHRCPPSSVRGPAAIRMPAVRAIGGADLPLPAVADLTG